MAKRWEEMVKTALEAGEGTSPVRMTKGCEG